MTTETPAPMNEVQKVALERAARMLQAAGVQFAILMPDGTKLGALEVCQPRTKTRVHNFLQFGCIETVRAMREGQSIVIPIPAALEGDKAWREAFAAAISSCGCSAFGSGNFITARTKDGSGVEALRIA